MRLIGPSNHTRREHDDRVGDNQERDEREHQRKMAAGRLGRERPLARHDAFHHERAQQDGRGHAAGDAEHERRDERPAQRRVVRRAGSEHALYARSARRGACGTAADGVGVGRPLRHAAPQSWQQADVGANGAAAEDEPPAAKRLEHAVAHAARRDALRAWPRSDTGHRERLRHGEQPQRNRQQPDAVPQVQQTEREARRGLDGVETDRGEEQAERAGDETLERRRADERCHERDADERQHEQLRGPEGHHQRPGDRDGEHQRDRAERRADERRGQRGAQRTAGLSARGQRVPVDDQRGRHRLAGHAEQNRRDVAGGRRDGNSAHEQRERRERAQFPGKRQQHRQGRRAAQAGQQSDAGAEADADQQEARRRPGARLEQSCGHGFEHDRHQRSGPAPINGRGRP